MSNPVIFQPLSLKQALLWLLLCFSLNGLVLAAPAPLQVGDRLPVITLNDQHGKAITIAADAQTLLFAIEKPASELLNGYLLKQDKDFLARKKAWFIADISGMPRLITKMFAIPALQERPYSILLAYDAKETAFIPRQKDHVTVLKIRGGRVISIHFVQDAAQLATSFD